MGGGVLCWKESTVGRSFWVSSHRSKGIGRACVRFLGGREER